MLRLLASGPLPLERLAASLGLDGDSHEALASWLELGVQLGELGHGAAGYYLRGTLSKALADPANDAPAAMLDEVVSLHRELLLQTPSMLREGRHLTFADADVVRVARSSRILEPFVLEASDEAEIARWLAHWNDNAWRSAAKAPARGFGQVKKTEPTAR